VPKRQLVLHEVGVEVCSNLSRPLEGLFRRAQGNGGLHKFGGISMWVNSQRGGERVNHR
jgi:hypothetical protein